MLRKLQRRLRRYPISSTVVISVIAFIYHYGSRFYERTLLSDTVSEILLALFMLFCIGLISGRREVLPASAGTLYAFKKSWWALTITTGLSILSLLSLLILGTRLATHPAIIFTEVALFSLSIGVFEEGLFRGLILNALLSKMGTKRSGVVAAVIISSFIFGFMHVLPSFVIGEVTDLSTLFQAAAKTLQAGILGMLFAVIYLRNHNLWSISIIHGLCDFFSLLLVYLYDLGEIDSYINTEVDPLSMIVSYSFILIISLPVLITAIRQLRRVNVPQFGFFVLDWFPKHVESYRD